MRILNVTNEEVHLAFNNNELIILNNALNEVCNGIDIEELEFQTRLGFERKELQELSRQLRRAIKK